MRNAALDRAGSTRHSPGARSGCGRWNVALTEAFPFFLVVLPEDKITACFVTARDGFGERTWDVARLSRGGGLSCLGIVMEFAGENRGLIADPRLFPFEHRYLELGDAVVHYIDEGQGPTLLFLHAAPGWSYVFREVIVRLRDRYRCIALDFPGFGLSSASGSSGYSLAGQSGLVRRFFQALDLRDLTLYMHDTAGPIGIHAAAALTERLRALILAGTFAWPLDGYPGVARMLRLVSAPLFRLIQGRTNALMRITAAIGPRGRRLSRAEKAGYIRAFPDPASRTRILDVFAELARNVAFLQQAEETLSSMRSLPALLIFGEKDPIRAVGFQARFERLFPLHRSVVVRGEAHFPHEGAPHVVAGAIREFMTWLERYERVGRAAPIG